MSVSVCLSASVSVCLSVAETSSDLPAARHRSMCSMDVIAEASDTATTTSTTLSPGVTHRYI